MGDEVLLHGCESIPVCDVVGEFNLLGGPEGRFSLFEHLPNGGVLDGEEDKAVRVHTY